MDEIFVKAIQEMLIKKYRRNPAFSKIIQVESWTLAHQYGISPRKVDTLEFRRILDSKGCIAPSVSIFSNLWLY